MASMTAVNTFRRTNLDIVALAQAELVAFMRSFAPGTSSYVVAAELADFYPVLLATYGEFAALIAVEFFDELRAEHGFVDRYRATMAPAVILDQAVATARWASGALFGADADIDAALRALTGATHRLVMQPGRESLVTSAERDPKTAGWARVPSGSDTCQFCRMLASRGAVYASEKTARLTASGRKYHDRCRCVPTPIWTPDDLPDGYDPEALYQEYLDLRAAKEA